MIDTAIAVFAYLRVLHLRRVLRALLTQLLGTPLPVQHFLDWPFIPFNDRTMANSGLAIENAMAG